MSSYFDRIRQLASGAADFFHPDDGVVRSFGGCEAALKWAYQILSVPGSYSHVKLGVHKVHRGVDDPAGEELRDLAHTITATLHQSARPQGALILAVLCGNDEGGRLADAIDLIVEGLELERPISHAQERELAAAALKRVRHEVLGWAVLPMTVYSKALGLKRESVFSARSSQKWREAIDVIEARVRSWHAQGSRDLDMALRAKGIVR